MADAGEQVIAFCTDYDGLHRGLIRQQLQVLRDTGFLSHPDRGVWTVK